MKRKFVLREGEGAVLVNGGRARVVGRKLGKPELILRKATRRVGFGKPMGRGKINVELKVRDFFKKEAQRLLSQSKQLIGGDKEVERIANDVAQECLMVVEENEKSARGTRAGLFLKEAKMKNEYVGIVSEKIMKLFERRRNGRTAGLRWSLTTPRVRKRFERIKKLRESKAVLNN